MCLGHSTVQNARRFVKHLLCQGNSWWRKPSLMVWLPIKRRSKCFWPRACIFRASYGITEQTLTVFRLGAREVVILQRRRLGRLHLFHCPDAKLWLFLPTKIGASRCIVLARILFPFMQESCQVLISLDRQMLNFPAGNMLLITGGEKDVLLEQSLAFQPFASIIVRRLKSPFGHGSACEEIRKIVFCVWRDATGRRESAQRWRLQGTIPVREVQRSSSAGSKQEKTCELLLLAGRHNVMA